MRKLFTAITFFCMITLSAWSQENKSPSNMEGNYAPPKGSIFDEDSKIGNNTPSEMSDKLPKNIILFNVSSMIRSNIYVTYERLLAENFSLSIGGGFYFARDYIGDISTADLYSKNIHDENGITASYYDLLDKDLFKLSTPSLQWGVSARYYIYSGSDARSYLEMGTRLYNFKYLHNDSKSDEKISEYNIKNKQLFCNVGFQWSRGNTVRLNQEFYFGFGLRQIISDEYDTSNSISYVLTGGTKTWYTPSVLLGYKIGFGW